MQSRPTRNDVARIAGTSGSTVSRVFSERTDIPIAEKTRERVLEAARQLGYVPDPTARALTEGRTGVVGFWICLEYSHYRAQVLDAMRAAVGASRLAMHVANADEEYWRDRNFTRTYRTSVDGIIAFDSSVSLLAFGGEGSARVPFVSMGAIFSDERSYVGIDLAAGTRQALDHLFETGRHRVAFLVPEPWQLHESGPRAEVYRSELAARGLAPDVILTEGDRVTEVRKALQRRFATVPPPDALFCVNDDVAIAASRALIQMGLRVGQDVAVLGCDGIREIEEEPCTITTIRQPIEEMCALALQFLNERIENPSAPVRRRILQPELVVRESTRPAI